MKSLDKVLDEEWVARIIFSPSHIKDGRISPTAFRLEMLRKPEDYISVLRNEEEDLDAVSSNFKARHEGDTRFGYTLLKVEDIRNLNDEEGGRCVEVSPVPSKSNPLHAGIYLFLYGQKVTAKDVSAEINLFQKELASLCGEIHRFEGNS